MPNEHGSGAPLPSYSDAYLKRILTETKTIAAVGVSRNEIRPSHYVARYLKTKGFTVLPVNPTQAGETVFGETILSEMSEIPADRDPIDMVDVFRNSEAAGQVVDDALEALLERGLRTIWMQIGVINHEAAARAEAKGVQVVMNRCPKIEYQRLFGELRIGGFNTGQISSRLR
ncbi:MAG: CoA-binding protein [Pseudomonadota bacterium]